MRQHLFRSLAVTAAIAGFAVAATAAPVLQVPGQIPQTAVRVAPAGPVTMLGGGLSPRGPIQPQDTLQAFYDCTNAATDGNFYYLGGTTSVSKQLDDGSFANGDNGPHTISDVTFGYVNVSPSTAPISQNAYAVVRFFANIHEADATTPHVNDVEAGGTYLGGFSVPLGSVPSGLFTEEVTLSTPIVFPGHSFWCEESFYRNSGLTSASTLVQAFYASGTPNIGSNVDGAFGDFDGDKLLSDDIDYSISEYFNFGADRTHGDPVAHVQFYLKLAGTAAAVAPVSIGANVQGSPALNNGVAYFGADDGKLYAFNASSNAPVAGFPVDLNAALGTAVKLPARPTVFTGAGGTAIYLTTNLGHTVKVNANGTVAWKFGPLAPSGGTTPAVTSDGNVYVDLSPTTFTNSRYLFRLADANGIPNGMSPYLGGPSTSTTPRAPAVTGNLVYDNVADGFFGDVIALDKTNLSVRATFGPNEDAFPPYVSGASTYVSTKAGHIYKVNSSTLAVDLTFGVFGKTTIGETVTTQAFPFTSGSTTTFYVGTANGHIWAVDGTTGAKTLLFSTPAPTAIGGILVTTDGTIAFGTADGNFYQVPAANAAGATSTAVTGAVTSTPAFDTASGNFYVVTSTGNAYSIPKAS